MENTTINEEQPVVIDNITTALTKANVTEQILTELKTYKGLVINGIDDKKGYEEVYKARQRCKNTRVIAVKICKKGREEAIAEQRRWIDKEKEVTGQIEEVEAYLQDQENKVDQEKERLKQEAIQKEKQRIQGRVYAMLDLGMSYNGSAYALGDHEVDSDDLPKMTDESFSAFLSNVKALADTLKAQQKLERERFGELSTYGFVYPGNDLGVMSVEGYNALLSEHKNAFEERQREKERLRKQAEDQARVEREQREEGERLAAQRFKFLAERRDLRAMKLINLGMIADSYTDQYHYLGVGAISFSDVYSMEDSLFDDKLKEIESEVSVKKAEQQAIREKEIADAEAKAAERERLRIAKEEEDRKEQERIKAEQEAERIASLSDKDKILVYVHNFNDYMENNPPPELKSKKYQGKINRAIAAISNALKELDGSN